MTRKRDSGMKQGSAQCAKNAAQTVRLHILALATSQDARNLTDRRCCTKMRCPAGLGAFGAVSEWLKGSHWKCGVRETAPRVRIPPAPFLTTEGRGTITPHHDLRRRSRSPIESSFAWHNCGLAESQGQVVLIGRKVPFQGSNGPEPFNKSIRVIISAGVQRPLRSMSH